jgi:hypothetical protein
MHASLTRLAFNFVRYQLLKPLLTQNALALVKFGFCWFLLLPSLKRASKH